MAKYVAGIDAGTTGATVMIFDLNGTLMGIGYREYPCQYPHPGWVEQDVNDLWNGVCEAAKEVIAKTGIDPKEIGSVGLSSQRGTFVPIDEQWNPLSNSIVWSDGRAGEEIKWIEENMEPAGIDINMGCPVPKVAIGAQAGASLMKDPQKIYDIVYIC